MYTQVIEKWGGGGKTEKLLYIDFFLYMKEQNKCLGGVKARRNE
jgi:hypothetical protein